MQDNVLLCRDDAECHVLGTFLHDRIYEFNAKATGYRDGRLLARFDEVLAGFRRRLGEYLRLVRREPGWETVPAGPSGSALGVAGCSVADWEVSMGVTPGNASYVTSSSQAAASDLLVDPATPTPTT